MKAHYLDTSALAKVFHEEQGSEIMAEIVSDPENEIWILDLSRIEFLSSLYRKYREGKLSGSDVAELTDLFEQQAVEFNIETLGPVILEEAELLMREYGKEHGLRTLDALQLGACRLLCEPGWWFVCADSTACKVARLCGIECINPLER